MKQKKKAVQVIKATGKIAHWVRYGKENCCGCKSSNKHDDYKEKKGESNNFEMPALTYYDPLI